MRILLTGGTGYLGSHLAQKCLELGHELACIVRNMERLNRLQRFESDVFLIETGKMKAKIPLFAPEIVIHTACTYARRRNTLEDVLEGNLLFPLDVLQISCGSGTRCWINTDTSLPPQLNAYALAKDQFRQWGKFYAETEKIQFLNLLLEQFYGPDAPEDSFLTWVIQKLKANETINLTAGTQRRDFIYIEDVVNVYNKLLECPFQETYLDIPVGTGTAPTIREIVEYLARLTHSSSLLCFGAVPFRRSEPDSHCDVSTLKTLKAMPRTSWREGMEYLVNTQTHSC